MDDLLLNPSRKRKATTLRAEDWEPHKAQIVELHITKGVSLKDVKDVLEEQHGFTATERQYRKIISDWRLDKNVKKREMKAIVRKRQQRKILEPEKHNYIFRIRDNVVEEQKIERWMKSHGVSDHLPYNPSVASTPSALSCETMRTPFASPGYTAASPSFSPRHLEPHRPALQMHSPALSIRGVLRSEMNTFAGQSPALTIRSLDSPTLGSFSPLGITLNQLPISTDSLGPRRRQVEAECLQSELSTYEMLHGPSHDYTLNKALQLCCLFINLGRYKAAGEVASKMVGECRSSRSRDDLWTYTALLKLGVVLRCQGFYGRAGKVLQQVLDSRKVLLGENHPHTANTMCELAINYILLGQHTEAEALLVRVIEKQREVLGEGHELTLISQRWLGLTYVEQARYTEAEELLRPTLKNFSRLFGKEDVKTLAYMDGLEVALMMQGRLREVEELQVDRYATCTRVLGKEHPITLSCLHFSARLRRLQGRKTEAVSMMASCLQGERKVHGPEHPRTKFALEKLSSWQAEDFVLV